MGRRPALALAALAAVGAVAAAETYAPRDVHVVVTGSASHALGVVACVRSVFVAGAAHGRVVAHVVIPAADAGVFRTALACALGAGDRWRVVAFDEASGLGARIARNVRVRHAKKQYLANAYNYARFYLAELLPGVPKVLWLDSDTIALEDVSALFDSALAGQGATAAVAAVPRARPVCGTFLNCSNAAALAELDRRGVALADLNAFNAGVSPAARRKRKTGGRARARTTGGARARRSSSSTSSGGRRAA